MVEAVASRVTAVELLDARERQWRRRLGVVSLAAEVLGEISVEHRELALGVLGHGYQRSAARPRLLRRWPAVHVVGMAGVAADRYENGTFWPKLVSLLEIPQTPDFQHEWGEAFLDNLNRLGLPAFDGGDEDAGSRYVGRILMHSGIPTFCLHDFFRLIGSRRARFVGLDPAGFVSWAAARAARRQLHGVDKPVARFLQYGGDFAVDVADRVFDLLDAVAGGSDGADVPLPERFRRVARQLHDEGAIVPVRDTITLTSQGESSDPRPRLVSRDSVPFISRCCRRAS